MEGLRMDGSNHKLIFTKNPGSLHIGKKIDWNIFILPSKQKCSFKLNGLQSSVIIALNHGARSIFLSSPFDTNRTKLLRKFSFEDYTSVLRYNGSLNNPLSYHFYEPVDTNKFNKKTDFSYRHGVWKTSSLQKIIEPSKRATSFQEQAPPIFLPFDTLVSIVIDNILFRYDAFWAFVSFKNESVWSVWVQKLLQELGESVMYIPGLNQGVLDCRETSIPRMPTYLKSWKCTERSTFFSCVLSLTNFMIEKSILRTVEYQSVAEWLDHLLNNGYEQPALVQLDHKQESLEPSYNVFHIPSYMNPIDNLDDTFKSICVKGISKCHKVQPSTVTFEPLNILLVIVFNRAGHYQSLDYLESIYRPYFKHILYCGTDINNFFLTFDKLKKPVSFLELEAGGFSNGEQGYQCVQLAIKMNYDVDGYFHVADDVLLNIWNLRNISTDKIWFQQSMRPANLTQPTVPDVWRNPNWWPWNSGRGRSAVERAIGTVRNLSLRDVMAKKFLETLARNAGGLNRVFYEVSDIFYIPSVLAKHFVYFASVFYSNNVYLEIAVPTIINGLAEKKDIVMINGSYLWYQDRASYRETFNYSNIFMHPVKPEPCLKDKHCMEFLCKKYLPCVFAVHNKH
ncbi:hypothetical protein LOTGIDRAFT_155619 [Lottia gigantea]|uniref:Uncharacterized protein n=1 Tax=Lottia gigantea TaxID=225164 RepID=V3ZJQ4_LOTGI|nr:hypothetical protein LOTGIDRAFT_155619 [Lottia gigantea]ESO82605.1 hypothetical protein LOTGIDRAFT_155619 [Lottia gigantea]